MNNNEFTACDMATAAADGFRDGVASVRPTAAVVPEKMLSIGVDATKEGAHLCLMVKGSEGTVQVIHSQFYAARTDGAGSVVQLPVRDLYTAPPAAAVVMPEPFPPESTPEHGWDKGYEAGYNDALDEVAHLNPTPTPKPASPWISVEDRLPLELCDTTTYETTDVLVSDGNTVCECTFARGGAHVGNPWRAFNNCIIAASSITHWTPLPAAPGQPTKEQGQ